jgi:hypothetical protein
MLQPLCTNGRVVFHTTYGAAWLRLPSIPESAQAARTFAAGKLDGEDAEFVSDVETVTSELVTNSIRFALKHGDPPRHVVPDIWLGVAARRRYCHLYVRDPYPVPPVKRIAADTDTSGRGLLIVELLTAAFWIEGRSFDKTCHAVVTKPGVVLTEDELDGLRGR